jgi:hypothetical protein
MSEVIGISNRNDRPLDPTKDVLFAVPPDVAEYVTEVLPLVETTTRLVLPVAIERGRVQAQKGNETGNLIRAVSMLTALLLANAEIYGWGEDEPRIGEIIAELVSWTAEAAVAASLDSTPPPANTEPFPSV